MFGTLPGLAAATQRTVTTLADRLLALAPFPASFPDLMSMNSGSNRLFHELLIFLPHVLGLGQRPSRRRQISAASWAKSPQIQL